MRPLARVRRPKLAEVFATRTRDEWAAELEPTEACVAAVLDLDEAGDHPHMAARGTVVEEFGVRQPGARPALLPLGQCRTPTAPVVARTCTAVAVLTEWGLDVRPRGEAASTPNVVHQA